MHYSADLTALRVDRLDEAQHPRCVPSLPICTEPIQGVDQLPLASIPPRERLARDRPVEEPLCLYATPAENEHRWQWNTFVDAVAEDGRGELVRCAFFEVTNLVGIQVSEQQIEPSQIDDAAIWHEKLGLAEPGVAWMAVIEQAQHEGHITQPMTRLDITFARPLGHQEREETVRLIAVITLGLIDGTEQTQLRAGSLMV